ncbi:MAG TPA: class I SAM-dependent RNA methyltransferase [Spirochaetota bacterium]|nr:class I SAM-dependent RNA methyltransferase [Spirochaetota bacterium]
MSPFDITATCAFGIEAVVVDELRKIGFDKTSVENGRVNFQGDYISIIKSNLWLRCADRIYIKIAEFRAADWDELFDGTKAVRWEDIIPGNGMMHVVGRSVKSKLHSVPDCQSIVKKAVVEGMKRKYRQERFTEDGPVYKIEISILNDIATLSLDTSGNGLNRRGYRSQQGEAPLKETLAAALVYLSRWRPDRMLADPFCGSGTIPIEAAMIAANIAPGFKRSFAAESWPEIPAELWRMCREETLDLVIKVKPEIYAADINKDVYRYAVKNAENAGVSDMVLFQKKPLSEFSTRMEYGCIICNPPYGERLSEQREVENLYREMGKIFGKLETWSYFILTALDDFEKFFGKKATKNRKLYNGKIKTHLYQYFGPLPPRKKSGEHSSDNV